MVYEIVRGKTLSRDSENVMGKRVFWDNENVTPPLWGVLPMP